MVFKLMLWYMYSMMTFNSSSYGFIHKRQQALWPNGLSRMILKTKYLTLGLTIITAIDRPYMYEPLPIKTKSFLWNCLISGKCHPLLFISEKRVRLSSDCHFFEFEFFVNGLAELTVITLFVALLFVISPAYEIHSSVTTLIKFGHS